MNVLVVGSGGREHALCWAIAKSPLLTKLHCAPGNAGIASVAACVPIAVEDVDGLVAFAQAQAIDLVMVGPETPLVLGLVDRLTEAGILAFGPTQAAAELEGSKAFMKDLVSKYGVPTAWYETFTAAAPAKAFIREKGAPIVVKASGLAAGKGVLLCRTVAEAEAAIDEIMGQRVFGDAGNQVVVEEFLEGEEASFFALVDGKTALPLAAAQDHKAVGDGDVGPNTGGMGAYSPAPVVDDALTQRIMEEIITPTVRGMAAEGRPFTGVLFAGIMIGRDGTPKLLEHNVRFGDPECQALMVRLKSDLLAVLLAGAQGRLDEVSLEWHEETALTVVMAAQGYPGAYVKNTEIRNLAEADSRPDVLVFHAGTKQDGDKIRAVGGRVLGVTALGATVREAQEKAYAAVDAIDWPEGFCRRDIGWRAVGESVSSV